MADPIRDRVLELKWMTESEGSIGNLFIAAGEWLNQNITDLGLYQDDFILAIDLYVDSVHDHAALTLFYSQDESERNHRLSP